MTPNQPQRRRAFADQIEYSAPLVDTERRLDWVERICLGVFFLAIVAVLAFYSVSVFGQTTQPTPTQWAPGTPDLIIAVDCQPSTILIKDAAGKDLRVDNFGRWADRGVNALFRSEASEDRSQWLARASAHGLKAFPSAPRLADGTIDLAAIKREDADPNVLGWSLDDEPDRRGVPIATIIRDRAAIKAISAKPVLFSCTGGGGGFDNEYYDGTALGQKAIGGPGHRAPSGWFGQTDAVVWDYHLCATGRADMWFIHDRMQDRAFEWSGGKDQLIYTECSPQNLDNKGRPGPTIAQYEAVARVRLERAKARGQKVKGFVIFPQRIGGGFQFDATPPELVAAMPAFHVSLSGKFGDAPWAAFQASLDDTRISAQAAMRAAKDAGDAAQATLRAATQPVTVQIQRGTP